MLMLTSSLTELLSTQEQNQLYLFRGWGEGLATVPEEDPKEKKTKLQTMPHTKQAPSRG